MLFGRRKPGFIEVEGEEKPELLDYIATLPDVEDPYPAMEEEEEEAPLTPAQELAEYIRIRSAAAQLTPGHTLETEIADFKERMRLLKEDETCGDIAVTEGAKDRYYYSKNNMSENYAMIAALVEEKDLPAMIAKMVRFNCETYPLPTPIHYFERHPYFATRPQLERAAKVMKSREEYSDIKEFENSEHVTYFYSEHSMTERYAKALAEPEVFAD